MVTSGFAATGCDAIVPPDDAAGFTAAGGVTAGGVTAGGVAAGGVIAVVPGARSDPVEPELAVVAGEPAPPFEGVWLLPASVVVVAATSVGAELGSVACARNFSTSSTPIVTAATAAMPINHPVMRLLSESSSRSAASRRSRSRIGSAFAVGIGCAGAAETRAMAGSGRVIAGSGRAGAGPDGAGIGGAGAGVAMRDGSAGSCERMAASPH